MKTIGMISGVAWPSSIVYYQTINELIASRLDLMSRDSNGTRPAELFL